MKLYVCFTCGGLVLAKAGELMERDLLQQVQAVAYLGPLQIEQVIEYLEQTYPDCRASLRMELCTFAVSANTVFRFQAVQRAQGEHAYPR